MPRHVMRKYACKHCTRYFDTKEARDKHQFQEGIDNIIKTSREMHAKRGPAWEKCKLGMSRFLAKQGMARNE